MKKVLNCIWVCSLLSIVSVAQAGSWQNNVALGGFNKVHIYTPDTQSSIGDGRALLVVLHGCTQSIDAYLTANLEDAAEAYGMVVAVPDAMNKAGFSCWSYWQGTRSRTAGDYKNVITLAQTLSADVNYNIDSDQVYVAGLSSGAAFANTTACIAPDVFAGMGISAGPSIGTSSSGALGSCEYADVATRCQQYAGSYAGEFSTQIASIAQGDADTTVDQCYNRQNAEGMADVYGVSELAGSNLLGSGTRTANEHVWQDGRVSMVWFNGVDHAWSGGQGASGSYINGSSINYAMYLGQYFLDHNQRVDRNAAPVVTNLQVQVSGQALTVSADVSDVDGTVEQAHVQVTDSVGNSYQYSTQSIVNGGFSLNTASLADDLYFVAVNAEDDKGAISATVSTSQRIGPPPPDTAPVLSNVLASVAGQCVTVSGDVVDINENLTGVVVAFATGNQTATLSGNTFSAEACNQPGGVQSIVVTATDSTSLSATDTLSVTVDAGVTATLDAHISAGRLDYTNYANCYLEYSTAAFKLNEIELSASQCQWQDDDASCTGPMQSCSGNGTGGGSGDGSGGGSQTCVEYNTANYYHKVAGRAYSTGNIYVPDYFAAGSNDPLAGSTWGMSNLYSLDGESWSLGTCP